MEQNNKIERMPLLFIGHGNPMNAILQNEWSDGLKNLAKNLPHPNSILMVSAHWFVPGTFITFQQYPPTIHDFSGFPEELNRFEYPAPGNPELAERIAYLCGEGASFSSDWGLDHGCWTVLTHLFPKANMPVVQLSVDNMLNPLDIIALGESLSPLRDEGVLIIGSGNITHNLHDALSRAHTGDLRTPEWALEFDEKVAEAVVERNSAYLSAAITDELGEINHPIPDHYLPLLYLFGAAGNEDPVSFPIMGFDMGSLSIRSIRWG